MREVVPFVLKHDVDPPDFLEMGIKAGLVRYDCTPGPQAIPPNTVELSKVEGLKKTYYERNWQAVLLKLIRFKNPNFAEAHTLTKQTFDMLDAE